MLANMVCSFIKQASQGRQGRIETTLAKAKAARVVAEKMVSLGKKGQDKGKTVHYRRLAASRLRAPSRTQFDKEGKVKGKQRREAWRESEDVVHILFDDIAPRFKDRPGGYTRIIKLGRRRGDAAEMAILEWVESEMAAVTEAAAAAEAKAKPEKKEEAAVEEKSEEKSEPEAAEKEATEEEASADTAEEKAEDTEAAPKEESEEAVEEKADSEEASEEKEDAPPAEPETESADEEASAEGEEAAKPEEDDKKKGE